MRILLALCALLSTAAYAGQATLSWQNPTQFEDGTVLVATDITATRIEIGTCIGTAFGTKLSDKIATGSVTTTVITSLAAGTYCFRAYTTAKGLESVASVATSGTVPQAAPKPPTLTTISTVAYRIKVERNKFALVEVGTVPLNVPCITSQTVNGYYCVARWQVKWSGSFRPEAVVVQCGGQA